MNQSNNLLLIFFILACGSQLAGFIYSFFIFLFENNCIITTNVTFTCMEHFLNMVNVSDQFLHLK